MKTDAVTDFIMAEDQFDFAATSTALSEPAGEGQPAYSPRTSRTFSYLCWPGFQFCSVWVRNVRSAENHPVGNSASPLSQWLDTRFKMDAVGLFQRILGICRLCTPRVSLIAFGRTRPHTSFPRCHLQRHFTSIHIDGQVFRGSWQMPISPQIRQLSSDLKEK